MIEMSGRVFGKLRVISCAGNNAGGTVLWNCICECGESRIIEGTGLRAGRNKSCGCASPRFTSERVKTHGASRTREYKIFTGMHVRCSEKAKGKTRRLYYEKGIRVCEEWGTFENFIADMGIPNKHESIDRIDGSKGYSKDNCRWATSKQQANNTAANHQVTYNGETNTVSGWAEIIGINANTLIYRLRRGWDIKRVFEIKPITSSTLKRLERKRNCVVCGSEFIPRLSQVSAGVGKTCSQKCNSVNRNK